MSTIIDTLLNIAKALFGLRGELAKGRRERKQDVQQFVSEIAGTVEKLSASLRQNIYPHKTCEEIRTHAQNMEAAIGDLVGKAKARELGEKLMEVWEVELLYMEIQPDSPDEKERKLSRLDEVAGIFRATAAFVRVSP